MKEIHLNQKIYEDIEEVSDEEKDMECTIFENNHEMQEYIGVSNNKLNIFLISIFYLVYIFIQGVY